MGRLDMSLPLTSHLGFCEEKPVYIQGVNQPRLKDYSLPASIQSLLQIRELNLLLPESARLIHDCSEFFCQTCCSRQAHVKSRVQKTA